MYDTKRAYEFTKSISFERFSGSKEEEKAADIIKSTVLNAGGNVWIEEFEVDHAEIEKQCLQVISPYQEEIEVTAMPMSLPTGVDGLQGELIFIESERHAEVENVEGKVVFLCTRLIKKMYEILVKKHAKAVISMSGSVYDKKEETDLDQLYLREPLYSLGNIPCFIIRAIDAERLLNKHAKEVRLFNIQSHGKINSQNVVAEIKGIKYPEQIVSFTAHYDSVKFSTGAYDNASGSAAIMEIFHYFIKNKPDRTLRFVWCGSEEVGLLGSKAYVAKHKDELKNYLYSINVDMIGVTIGKEIAVSTAENAVVNYIDFLGKEIGISISSSQGVYSSDSTPFADYGVPSTSFARISPLGGAKIHSRLDVIDHMSSDAYDSSLKILLTYACRVVNSIYFPINREVPANMKEEIDKYYQRKKEEKK